MEMIQAYTAIGIGLMVLVLQALVLVLVTCVLASWTVQRANQK